MAKIAWGTFTNVDASAPDFKINPHQAAALFVEKDSDFTEIWLFEGATVVTTDAIDDVEAALGSIGVNMVMWATLPSVDPLRADFKLNPWAVSFLAVADNDPDQTLIILTSGQQVFADLNIDSVETLLTN